MSDNDKTIRSKLEGWAVANAPSFLEYLRKMSGMVRPIKPEDTSALKALLLFKTSYVLFENQRDLVYYLEDTFELEADRFYRCDVSLSGILFLRPSDDYTDLSPREVSILEEVLEEVKEQNLLVARGGPSVSSWGSDVTIERSASPIRIVLREAAIWGPLDDDWFRKDKPVMAIYEQSDMPDFYEGRSS